MQDSIQNTGEWTKYPEANCNYFLKMDFFLIWISFQYSKPNYNSPVLTIISQSDVEIIKISKYITVNSNGIAQVVGFFLPYT